MKRKVVENEKFGFYMRAMTQPDRESIPVPNSLLPDFALQSVEFITQLMQFATKALMYNPKTILLRFESVYREKIFKKNNTAMKHRYADREIKVIKKRMQAE